MRDDLARIRSSNPPSNQTALNHAALAAMGISDWHASGYRGQGIAIGFVDYGFDWAHRVFRDPTAGDSRFYALWSQADNRVFRADRAPFFAPSSAPSAQPKTLASTLAGTQPRPLASSLTDTQLAGTTIPSSCTAHQARLPPLAASCRAQGYNPHAHYFGPTASAEPTIGAHGTHMASIAGGSWSQDFCGVAPEAYLIGVHLDLPDTAWQDRAADGTPEWRGASQYADAQPIVAGINFLVQEAEALHARGYIDGLVINLSIGTWAGAHTGAGAVAQTINAVVAAGEHGKTLPVAVCVGAGNAGCDHGHSSATIDAGAPHVIDWMFDTRAPGFS